MIKYIDCDGKEKIFFTKEEYEAAKQIIPYIAYETARYMLYFEYIWQQKNKKGDEK